MDDWIIHWGLNIKLFILSFSYLDNNTRCISDTEDSGDCAVYNDTSSCPSEYVTKIDSYIHFTYYKHLCANMHKL